MIGGIGIGELMVILLVVLLLFGAKRLPEIARSLGSSVFEFRKAMNSTLSEIRDAFDEKPVSSGNMASKSNQNEKTPRGNKAA